MCNEQTPLIIMGDLNSRTGLLDDNFTEPNLGDTCTIESVKPTGITPKRRNCDKVVNQHGRSIIEICQAFNLNILNGRSRGDPLGNFTYNDPNLGASAIDYSICSSNIYEWIKNFMVLPQNEISDHCKIVTEFHLSIPNETPNIDKYHWEDLSKDFKWDSNQSTRFYQVILNSKDCLKEIKQRLEAGLIDSSGKKIQELIINAAQNVFEPKPKKSKGKKGKNTKNQKSKNQKKWFDKECNEMKHDVRKIGREKNREPFNTIIRQKYQEKLKLYKSKCNHKRNRFWQTNFEQIENSLNDPKRFWEVWKKCSEYRNTAKETGITGEAWFNHFSKLHTEHPDNESEVTPGIEYPTPCRQLDILFSKNEIDKAIKKLKNNKAVGFDRISNEMLKNSPTVLVNLLLDYINLCINKSLASDSFCKELITPIFKDGSSADPDNYRGICVSSAITKLFLLMINARIQDFVDQKCLVSKNQIGFKKNCRTSDHLLTLKAIIKKHVTIGKKKMYACFVDLKKAYDSVWHRGLFHKLRKMRLTGKIMDLVENIYKKKLAVLLKTVTRSLLSLTIAKASDKVAP